MKRKKNAKWFAIKYGFKNIGYYGGETKDHYDECFLTEKELKEKLYKMKWDNNIDGVYVYELRKDLLDKNQKILLGDEEGSVLEDEDNE